MEDTEEEKEEEEEEEEEGERWDKRMAKVIHLSEADGRLWLVEPLPQVPGERCEYHHAVVDIEYGKCAKSQRMPLMELYILIAIVTVVAIAGMIYSGAKEKEKEEAHFEYQKSLGLLKSDPNNPNLRQQTLASGRHFSNLTRYETGATVFDEVALMNDINAVCPLNLAETDKSSVKVRLETLDELKQQGLILEDEYIRRRTRILDEI